ncbi:MAG: hypothetical protein KKA73_29120 [Chloroflexi bacterium]|nr:hypothetical protein [Chloroflexota bacterium]MBU1751757.1 hypothetical protein [Chloroflexota bacterium]MBU1877581.1 hypothetical protein [Chloroflexota bacterium]
MDEQDQASPGYPQVGDTGFGWIEIDGERWEKDVLITADGRARKRPKKLSKPYSTGHTPLGPEEVERAVAAEPAVLLIGTGQWGALPVLTEAQQMAQERSVLLETMPTLRAIQRYRELVETGQLVAAIFHLTC